MKKFRFAVAGVLLSLFLALIIYNWWPYHYKTKFQYLALKEVIEHTIESWNLTLDHASLEFLRDHEINQQLQFDEQNFFIKWKIDEINDSVSKVWLFIHSDRQILDRMFNYRKDRNHLEGLFGDFDQYIQGHLSRIKIKVEGKNVFEQTGPCLCKKAKTRQSLKATAMMRDFPILEQALLDYDLSLNGSPFIRILDWNRDVDSINYDFCLPLHGYIESETVQSSDIFLDTLDHLETIMVVYNGNYMTSDHAWYYALNYAKERNICIEEKPIEVFIDNPNFGYEEEKWTTNIYFPLCHQIDNK